MRAEREKVLQEDREDEKERQAEERMRVLKGKADDLARSTAMKKARAHAQAQAEVG
jgi:hypothetical protein